MWSTFASSFLLLGTLATQTLASTSKYTASLPENAIIAETRDQLNAYIDANPETVLISKNGGFVIEDAAGTIQLATGDSLIDEFTNLLSTIPAPQAGHVSKPRRGVNVLERQNQGSCPARHCFVNYDCSIPGCRYCVGQLPGPPNFPGYCIP